MIYERLAITISTRTVSGADSLRVRFNTIWIGLNASREHPDWIGLGQ